MKNTLLVLICLVFVSCAPKTYELVDGTYTTDKKWHRQDMKHRKYIESAKYRAKVTARIERKNAKSLKKLTAQDVDFLEDVSEITVVYDTTVVVRKLK